MVISLTLLTDSDLFQLFLHLQMSVNTRIMFPGFQPWFGQHGGWQKTFCLVQCNFSHYSYFTFHSCATILVGPCVTCNVSGVPFLCVGCVGVSEVGLEQAAVGPACGTLSEAGQELHAHIHEEGTCQLDHCALAGVSHCFIRRAQEILHAPICPVRERNWIVVLRLRIAELAPGLSSSQLQSWHWCSLTVKAL